MEQNNLQKGITAVANYSPILVVGAIILSIIFCLVIDCVYFKKLFENFAYGTIGYIVAFFIFVVRGTLLFHSYNGFTSKRYFMGALSMLLQVVAITWVCMEAPKVSEIIVNSMEIEKQGATNTIRFIAISASIMELLLILSIETVQKKTT